MEKTNVVIIMGRPSCGKNVLSEGIYQHLTNQGKKVLVISTGDSFRDMPDSFTKRLMKEKINQGKLIPDLLAYTVVGQAFLKEKEPFDCIIFNGFPRNVNQAAELLNLIRFLGVEIIKLILIQVSIAVVNERRKIRNGEQGRGDDDFNIFRTRLAEYEKETAPVIPWFERSGYHVCRIYGNRDRGEVLRDVLKVI